MENRPKCRQLRLLFQFLRSSKRPKILLLLVKRPRKLLLQPQKKVLPPLKINPLAVEAEKVQGQDNLAVPQEMLLLIKCTILIWPILIK